MSLFAAYRTQFHLHFIVLLWGFTGILGNLITIPSSSIVWYRMGIAFVGILPYLIWKKNVIPSVKGLLTFLGTGLIIAIHWVLFFEAIKVSNVTITLTCLSSATFFTALIEPLFFKRRIIPYELIFGLLVVAGLFMIYQVEKDYSLGVIYSLISAFMAGLFTVINGKLVKHYSPSQITTYEMLGGVIGVSIYLSISDQLSLLSPPELILDWLWLLILGLVCTAYAFVVSIDVMKELSPYTVSISVNMEPIYAIILALIIFGDTEKMSVTFYFGAILIMATIFANAILKNKTNKKTVS